MELGTNWYTNSKYRKIKEEKVKKNSLCEALFLSNIVSIEVGLEFWVAALVSHLFHDLHGFHERYTIKLKKMKNINVQSKRKTKEYLKTKNKSKMVVPRLTSLARLRIC